MLHTASTPPKAVLPLNIRARHGGGGGGPGGGGEEAAEAQEGGGGGGGGALEPDKVIELPRSPSLVAWKVPVPKARVLEVQRRHLVGGVGDLQQSRRAS